MSNMIAAANLDFLWGIRCLAVGASFTLIGVFNRYVIQRTQTSEERRQHNLSYGGGRIFALGVLGVPLLLTGIVFLLLSRT
jgi:hypothetical protein